ncbi:MAG: hypothetical protein Q8P81_00530 [Nanoarchaeota archaeon]|nr:hypothetical protein [Nanoarchaeota archaeon]
MNSAGAYLKKMEENKKKFMTTLKEFHDKRYKHLLLLPLLIMLLCIAYMIFFYASTGDFMHRDISLTGGTSITIYENMNLDELRIYLSGKVDSFIVREVSDLVTGDQIAVIIETTSDQEITTNVIEDYLGYGLTEKNSSIEFTGSDLSENFLKQLVFALLTAFLFMGWVIFIIFGENRKIKILTGILSIFPTLMFFFFHTSLNVIFTASLLALAINLFFYFKESIPSLAIVVSAFADIFMTLTVFNILGIQMSTSGIVAFLMIIGYSVDTDILLTNRVIKGHEDQLNSRLLSAFKTGMTMTLTSLLALLAALLVVMNFSDDLTKIFLILVIGLSFDLMNTWITNVSILKWWYLKNKNEI